MLTAWPGADHAVILAVGPHDRSAADVYDLLLTALNVDVSEEDRTKPACCDEAGEPPTDPATAEELAIAVDQLARRHRRR